jgi:hypothetical protein
MTFLTLLVKAAHMGQLKQVDELLQGEFEQLDVEFKVTSNSANRWIQVEVSGEDEGIAASYINKKIGTCPTTLENAKALPELKGYITKIDANKQEVRVDVGVFEPKFIQATVPLATLQTQLADGRNLALKQIAEAYGLADKVPLTVKLVESSLGEEGLLAELSVSQVEKLKAWQGSLLDRLIILGAARSLVDLTLERTRLERDVIDVEVLGLFEYALVCKLGTDAAGLIPRIGRYMRYAVFVVFNARKSTAFVGEQGLTL